MSWLRNWRIRRLEKKRAQLARNVMMSLLSMALPGGPPIEVLEAYPIWRRDLARVKAKLAELKAG